MTPENSLFIYSAKIYPSEDELNKLNSCLTEIKNWKEITQKMVSGNMGSLFHVKVPLLSNSTSIPGESLSLFKQSYFQVLSRNMVLYNLLKETINLLSERGIEVIVLKGAYLSEALYKDVALRTLSDIVLLCKNEEEAQKAFQILLEAGYDTDKDDEMLLFLRDKVGAVHLPQVMRYGIPIELHVRLYEKDESYEFSHKDMWGNSRKISLNGANTYVPDLTDMLIHTCLHLDKHFNKGQIQLSWINDVVNILEVCEEKLDWLQIIGRSIQYKCEEVVFKYIMLANRQYKAPVPLYIVSEYIYYVSEDDIALFRKYLAGFQGEHYSVASGLSKVRAIDKVSDKLKYVLWMIFPSRKYMMRSYRIQHRNRIWLYYPYRLWLGVLGIGRTLYRREKRDIKRIK